MVTERGMMLRCLLALLCLQSAGCCSSDGVCDISKPKAGLGWSPSGLHIESSPFKAVVDAVGVDDITLSATFESVVKRSFNVFVKNTRGVFFVGQKLDIQHCRPLYTRTSWSFWSITDEGGRLLFVSSFPGSNALGVSCMPKGLKVERVDNNCCNIEDDCGGKVPISLKFTGDNVITLANGQDGQLEVQNRTYYVVNASSYEQEDDGECTDLPNHTAHYGLVLNPK